MQTRARRAISTQPSPSFFSRKSRYFPPPGNPPARISQQDFCERFNLFRPVCIYCRPGGGFRLASHHGEGIDTCNSRCSGLSDGDRFSGALSRNCDHRPAAIGAGAANSAGAALAPRPVTTPIDAKGAAGIVRRSRLRRGWRWKDHRQPGHQQGDRNRRRRGRRNRAVPRGNVPLLFHPAQEQHHALSRLRLQNSRRQSQHPWRRRLRSAGRHRRCRPLPGFRPQPLAQQPDLGRKPGKHHHHRPRHARRRTL